MIAEIRGRDLQPECVRVWFAAHAARGHSEPMCGRFVSPDEAAIERAWHLGRGSASFARRYNVAPTAIIPVLRLDRSSGRRELAAARWGLIPHWWKESKPPGFSFNARIEEAVSKPMWRDACRNARCLIPAEGWYEWKEGAHDAGAGRRPKQPYFIRPRDRQPFCFAGVMARWVDRATGEAIASCAVLTTAAAGALAMLHERMPVVLPDQAHGAWLDAGNDGAHAAALARTAAMHAVDRMEHYAVSPRVNDARIDDAQLLEPLPAAES